MSLGLERALVGASASASESSVTELCGDLRGCPSFVVPDQARNEAHHAAFTACVFCLPAEVPGFDANLPLFMGARVVQRSHVRLQVGVFV